MMEDNPRMVAYTQGTFLIYILKIHPHQATCVLSLWFMIQTQGECQAKGNFSLQMLLPFPFTKERKTEQHHIKLDFYGFHTAQDS